MYSAKTVKARPSSSSTSITSRSCGTSGWSAAENASRKRWGSSCSRIDWLAVQSESTSSENGKTPEAIASSLAVHDLAPDDGEHDVELRDRGRGDTLRIVGERAEVGPLAGLERAERVLLEL